MTRDLTEDERTTLTNGLRVAAERFDANAVLFDKNRLGSIADDPRMVEQFHRQAVESRKLAGLLEDAERITLAR